MGHRRLAGAQAHDSLGGRTIICRIPPEMERHCPKVESNSVLSSSVRLIYIFRSYPSYYVTWNSTTSRGDYHIESIIPSPLMISTLLGSLAAVTSSVFIQHIISNGTGKSSIILVIQLGSSCEAIRRCLGTACFYRFCSSDHSQGLSLFIIAGHGFG